MRKCLRTKLSFLNSEILKSLFLQLLKKFNVQNNIESMKKLTLLFIFGGIILLNTGCFDFSTESNRPEQVEGLIPIYFEGDDVTTIQSLPEQPIEKLGKIYYKAPYIFINESFKGIHVVDNSDPANPQKIAFIDIPGNRDISIKGNRMYVDNFQDLVVLDITDIHNVSVVSRLEGRYEFGDGDYPENYRGYFECVDANRGKIIGWTTATIDNPKCWR